MRDDPRVEGYMKCLCGQWVINLHGDCRAIASTEQIRRHLEIQQRIMAPALFARADDLAERELFS